MTNTTLFKAGRDTAALPGNPLRGSSAHPGAPPGLKGDKRSLWSMRVAANWRITFEFENGDVYILDLGNYH